DRHARLLVVVDGEPHLRQLPVHPVVGGVEDFGPVQGDEQHAVRAALEDEVLVLLVVDHRGSLSAAPTNFASLRSRIHAGSPRASTALRLHTATPILTYDAS